MQLLYATPWGKEAPHRRRDAIPATRWTRSTRCAELGLEDGLLSWYVAQTEPFRGILAEAEIKALGFEVFNPKIKTTRVWSRGRTTESVSHYIPGYIFTRFDIDEDTGWQRINDARGVKEFMWAAPETPARVRDSAMEPLMGLCVDGFLPGRLSGETLFKVGQVVKVKGGIFSGPVTAVALKRLTVMMEIFGAKREIMLAKKDVESIT